MQENPSQQLSNWLSAFASALAGANLDAAQVMFAEECYWRDLVAFTWNIVTMESPDEIREMFAATLTKHSPPIGRSPSRRLKRMAS